MNITPRTEENLDTIIVALSLILIQSTPPSAHDTDCPFYHPSDDLNTVAEKILDLCSYEPRLWALHRYLQHSAATATDISDHPYAVFAITALTVQSAALILQDVFLDDCPLIEGRLKALAITAANAPQP